MENIVIVGGSSGIGLALVQKLTAKDCKVTNISRSPCPVASVTNYTADVKNPKELSAAFSKLGAIDALIYCAGTSLAAPVECVKPADYRDLFEVNLLGAVECTRLAMPLLTASGNGRIIYASSSAAVVPIAFDSFYSASKAALVMFSRAVDLETDKVKTTAALIGGTRTQFSFKRKIYTDCDKYDKNLKSAADSLIKIEQTGYDSNAVASGLYRLLRAKNPPPVAAVGFKNKLELRFYKLMPSCVKQMIDKRIYKLEF